MKPPSPAHAASLVAMALALLLALPAHAARLALVIGNAAYTDGPLKNPVNDARAVQAKLSGLGFDVTKVENLKRRDIGRTVNGFASRIRPGDDVVVFYAGHGVQVKGINYLPAVDADIQSEEDVPLNSLNLGNLLERLDEAKAGVKILLLDACRNNPYARSFRSGTRGLARVQDAPSGTLMHFATRPGSVAADGTGSNGLYTTELLRHIDQPGMPIEQMLKRVSAAVDKASKGQQEPWTEGSLRGDFYFQPAAGTQVAGVTPVPTGQRMQAHPEDEAWAAAKAANTPGAYRAYLSEFPSGRYTSAARIALGGASPQPAAAAPQPAPTAAATATTSAQFTAIDASGNPTAPGSHACVKDSKTGLLWSAETMGAMDWDSAMRSGDGYSRCGFNSGWRLPGRDELKTLAVRADSAPTADMTYFPDTQPNMYWTKDTSRDPNVAWVVYFNIHGTDAYLKTNANYVRLVRSGP